MNKYLSHKIFEHEKITTTFADRNTSSGIVQAQKSGRGKPAKVILFSY